MELLLLGTFILLEIGFAAFTLKWQREIKTWRRNRLILDGAELVIFLCMTLLPGIDLGFRYRFWVVLLITRIVIAGLRLLICRKKQGVRKVSNTIMGVLLTGILFLVTLTPAFVFADYNGREVSGPYTVAESKVILVDQNREETFESDGSKREVPVHFYYPQGGESKATYPMVIFSHGAFGYYQSNTSTYMELASHGYVVLSLDHPYHSFFTTDTDGKTIIVNTDFLNEVNRVNEDAVSEEEIIKISHRWLELRKADMNFVIDTMKSACATGELPSMTWFLDGSKKETITSILNMTNTDTIGLMGHSLGGATSVALGRERDDISAVIDLDGTMLSEELGYKDGAYIMEDEPYPTPVLSVNSALHQAACEQSGSYYVNNVVLSNALDGQSTYIRETAHMNFTDLPLFAPPLAAFLGIGEIDPDHCVEVTNDIVLQYMDTYLKGEGHFQVEESYE